MTEGALAKLFEHNNWANERIIVACSSLAQEHLDAAPMPGSDWSIRRALSHIVEAQRGYLNLLTLPPEERHNPPVPFAELQESAAKSGEGLLALALGAREPIEAQLRTKDGYLVERWVVLLQIINHATEHRRQIAAMLKALGVAPPDIDGWSFAEMKGALIPVSGERTD